MDIKSIDSRVKLLWTPLLLSGAALRACAPSKETRCAFGLSSAIADLTILSEPGDKGQTKHETSTAAQADMTDLLAEQIVSAHHMRDR